MTSFKLVAIIIALLIGSFVVHARNFDSRCGRDEHFERCAKPISCQHSCKQSNEIVCAAICTPTCVCDGNRVRNRFNRCVLRHEC